MTNKPLSTALRLLARRDHSIKELTDKLKLKGYALADIHPVIEECLQKGYLNEKRFTENYINWRRRKGYGPLRISQELQARGIPDDMIAELLQITDNAWFIEARQVWQKRFRGQVEKDFRKRAKQMHFLQYRGFTKEQIQHLVLGKSEEFEM